MGHQKAKTHPKNRSKFKAKIEGTIENKSCSAIQIDPKKVYEFYSTPIVAHWGPKQQKGPQNYANIKIRIERSIENKSYLSI